MPLYDITDTETGESLTIEGEAPPSEQDVAEIFASRKKQPSQTSRTEPLKLNPYQAAQMASYELTGTYDPFKAPQIQTPETQQYYSEARLKPATPVDRAWNAVRYSPPMVGAFGDPMASPNADMFQREGLLGVAGVATEPIKLQGKAAVALLGDLATKAAGVPEIDDPSQKPITGNIKALLKGEDLPVYRALELAIDKDLEEGKKAIVPTLAKFGLMGVEMAPEIYAMRATPKGTTRLNPQLARIEDLTEKEINRRIKLRSPSGNPAPNFSMPLEMRGTFKQLGKKQQLAVDSLASGYLFGYDEEGKFVPRQAFWAAMFPGGDAVSHKAVGGIIEAGLQSPLAPLFRSKPFQISLQTAASLAVANAIIAAQQYPQLAELYKTDRAAFDREVYGTFFQNFVFELVGWKSRLKRTPETIRAVASEVMRKPQSTQEVGGSAVGPDGSIRFLTKEQAEIADMARRVIEQEYGRNAETIEVRWDEGSALSGKTAGYNPATKKAWVNAASLLVDGAMFGKGWVKAKVRHEFDVHARLDSTEGRLLVAMVQRYLTPKDYQYLADLGYDVANLGPDGVAEEIIAHMAERNPGRLKGMLIENFGTNAEKMSKKVVEILNKRSKSDQTLAEDLSRIMFVEDQRNQVLKEIGQAARKSAAAILVKRRAEIGIRERLAEGDVEGAAKMAKEGTSGLPVDILNDLIIPERGSSPKPPVESLVAPGETGAKRTLEGVEAVPGFRRSASDLLLERQQPDIESAAPQEQAAPVEFARPQTPPPYRRPGTPEPTRGPNAKQRRAALERGMTLPQENAPEEMPTGTYPEGEPGAGALSAMQRSRELRRMGKIEEGKIPGNIKMPGERFSQRKPVDEGEFPLWDDATVRGVLSDTDKVRLEKVSGNVFAKRDISPDEKLPGQLSGATDIFAYKADGKTIGTAAFWQNGTISVLVDPAYRRLGVATKLYTAAEQAGVPVREMTGRGMTSKEGRALSQSYLKRGSTQQEPSTKLSRSKSMVSPEERKAAEEYANRLAAMPEEQRDNVPYYENSLGYKIYDARKILKNKEGVIKRVTENNSGILWQYADAVIRVKGKEYELSKQEDPDNEDLTVWYFNRIGDYESVETYVDTKTGKVEELMAEIEKWEESQAIDSTLSEPSGLFEKAQKEFNDYDTVMTKKYGEDKKGMSEYEWQKWAELRDRVGNIVEGEMEASGRRQPDSEPDMEPEGFNRETYFDESLLTKKELDEYDALEGKREAMMRWDDSEGENPFTLTREEESRYETLLDKAQTFKKPDKLSRGKALTKEDAEKILSIVKSNPDGFTIDPSTGEKKTTGFVVAPSKASEVAIPEGKFTRGALSSYLDQFQPVFEKYPEQAFFGGWKRGDGYFVLDVAFVFDNVNDALYVARNGQQDAIFHLDEYNTINTEPGIQELSKTGKWDNAERPELRRFQEDIDRAVREARDAGLGVKLSRNEPLSDQDWSDLHWWKSPRTGEEADGRRDVPSKAAKLRPVPGQQGDGFVALNHWSKVDLTGKKIDPKYYGTGYAGEEKARRDGYPEDWVNRSYFGLKGYSKEQGLGKFKHTVEVNAAKLYDIQADPLNLWQEADRIAKERYGNDERGVNTVMERLISEAGYSGYFSRNHKIAASFKPVKSSGRDEKFSMEKFISGEEQASFKGLPKITRFIQDYSKRNRVVPRGTRLGTEAGQQVAIDAIADHTRREILAWREAAPDYVPFYTTDIIDRANPDLQEYARKKYGRKLTPSEVALFHLVSAFGSGQATPKVDSQIGIKVLDRYISTGTVTGYSKKPKPIYKAPSWWAEKGIDVAGKTPVQAFWNKDKTKWVPKGHPDATKNPVYDPKKKAQISKTYNVRGIDRLNAIMDYFGGDLAKTIDWLGTMHTWDEIRKVIGDDVAKKLKPHENLNKTGESFGAFVLGNNPKLGSYILNRWQKLGTITLDMWATRTGQRFLNEKITGDPWKLTKIGMIRRKIMKEAWEKAASQLGVEPAQVQEMMWDAEKMLYAKLGHKYGDPEYISSGVAEELAALSKKSKKKYSLGDTFQKEKEKLPILAGAPAIPDYRRVNNDAIKMSAFEWMKKFYGKTIKAADGNEILIKNPKWKDSVAMYRHITYDNKTGTFNPDKAVSVPAVDWTLQNAQVRLYDPQNRTRAYVARLAQDKWHMVFVDSNNRIEYQTDWKPGQPFFETQFRRGNEPGNRSDYFTVEWEAGNGDRSKSPAAAPQPGGSGAVLPTQPAQPKIRPGPTPGQEKSSLSRVEDVFKQPKPTRPGIGRILSETAESFRTGLVSEFRPMDKMAKDIAKQYGGSPRKISGVFEALKGSTGKADADLYEFDTAMKAELEGVDLLDFNSFLFSKRSLDRLRMDIATGEDRRKVGDFTQPDLTLALQQLESKIGPDKMAKLDRAARIYQQYMDAALRLQVESGRMSPEVYNDIKNGNQFYAPFKLSKYAELTTMPEGTGRRIDTPADYTKAMKGIESPDFKLSDMLAAARQAIITSRILAEKNNAMKSIADLAVVDTGNLFIKKLGPSEEAPTGMGVVNIFENGIKNRYAVRPEVSNALQVFNANNTDAGNFITTIFSGIGTTLRATATSLNIPFQASNLLADVPRAALISEYGIRNPLRHPLDAAWFVGDFIHSMYSSIAGDVFGSHNKLFQDFLRSGAAGVTVQEHLSPKMLRYQPKTGLGKMKRFGRGVLLAVPDFAAAIEQTSKVLGVKRAMRIHGAMSGAELAKRIPEAITEIRRFSGSPDFGRQGRWIRQAKLNLLFMFLNARIQGTAADVGRAIGMDGGKKAFVAWARMLSAIGIPTIVATLLNNSEEYKEDYEKIPQRDKNNYWIVFKDPDENGNIKYIVNDNGEKIRDYWRIPKREAAKWTANTIEAAIKFAEKKDPKGLAEFAGTMLEEISPINITGENIGERFESAASSINPAAKWPIEVGTGRSMWKHSEIIPERMKQAKPEEQYKNSTPAIFIKAAEKMPDVAPDFMRSPLMIEHAVQSFTAGFFTQFMKKPISSQREGFESWALMQRFQAAPFTEDKAAQEKISELKQEAATKSVIKSRIWDESYTNNKDDLRAFMKSAMSNYDRQIGKPDEKVFRSAYDLWVAKKSGISYLEQQVLSLPVEQRAKYVLDKVKETPRDLRKELLRDLSKKRILTQEVAKVIAYGSEAKR